MIVPLAFDRLLSVVSPSATFRYARRLDRAGDQAVAFRQFVRAARRGHREAACSVGKYYLAGTGIPRSVHEGAHWLHRAAQRGSIEAHLILAQLSLRGQVSASFAEDEVSADRLFVTDHAATKSAAPDFKAALAWARPAAEAGSADGQALVGYVLTAGPEDLRDLDAAYSWYRRAAEGGSAQGHLGCALSLSARSSRPEDRQEVIEHLKRACDHKLPAALYLMGILTDAGVGVPISRDAALAHWRQAAERGHADAQFRLGLALLDGKDTPEHRSEGETWLRRAALRGHVAAATALGSLLARRNPPEYAEAVRWLRYAAEAGNADAAKALASLYLSGSGVAPDTREAVRLLRLAVSGGNADARIDLGNLILRGLAHEAESDVLQGAFDVGPDLENPIASFNLAVSHATGVGGPRDDARAAQLMRKAAAHFPKAQLLFARMLAEGRGVAPDLVQARYWLGRAADAGLAEAKVALGEMLLNGRGGPPDRDMARRLFEEAAAAGDGGAMFALGALESDGGVAGAAALRRFRQAAEQGHGLAQWVIARHLQTGTGVEMDRDEATRWLMRAAAQGIVQAEEDLRRMNSADILPDETSK